MSDIKEFYITLQKYFWSCESDLANQMNSAKNQLLYHRINADSIMKPIELTAKIDMLNKIQHDINKIMED